MDKIDIDLLQDRYDEMYQEAQCVMQEMKSSMTEEEWEAYLMQLE